MAAANTSSTPTTGLVLTGGGARAAYQVGVLKAIAQIRRDSGAPATNPFPVIAGTSAGAINAAALACRADNFDAAVDTICEVWENFHAEQVYRSDSFGVIRTGARWLTMMSIGWVIARWRRARPRSLLDNSPLQALLTQLVSTDRLHQVMKDGHLNALAVTASSYGSGLHVTFYDAVADILPWTRSQRIAVRDSIGVQHLLASSAIPFVFPAVALNIGGHTEYCGDGSMRQAAPISPAVHLGAERILVVGAGRMHEPPGERAGSSEYPNLAQIAGHALSNIFLDALAVDVERLQRINSTLALLTPEARTRSSLKPIEVLVIAPSQRLDDIAARHLGALPLPIRGMLRGVGVEGRGDDARGAALASYLLFEAPYTRELMALGVADTMNRRADVVSFFGW
jgi:NTE family protein